MTVSASNQPSNSSLKNPFVLLTFYSIVYFLLAKFGMSLIALKPSNITLLWLPSGLAFALYLHFGHKTWIWICAASFFANYSGMNPEGSFINIIHTVISASIDATAGFFAAWTYRKFLPRGIETVSDFFPFVMGVAFLTGLFTALLLCANLVAGGFIEASGALNFIVMIILADMLGILLIAPIYLKAQTLQTTAPKEYKIFILLLLSKVVVIMLYATEFVSGSMYLTLPLLVVMSFYVNIAFVSVASLISLVSIAAITAHGYGEFVSADHGDSYAKMMMFLVATSLTSLGLSIQNQQIVASNSRADSLENEANTDELTGLLNRRSFYRIANAAFDDIRSNSRSSETTLAILDLDFFKKINDTYGHAIGDQVLRDFGHLLETSIGPEESSARLGGEEFVILLPNCSMEEAKVKMEQLRKRQENAVTLAENQKLQVTVSIGISRFDANDARMEDTLQRADNALYDAKRSGRNAVIGRDIPD